MSQPSDLDRIVELTKRLEELCREGEEIRDKIARIAREAPLWPDRRVVGRLFTDAREPYYPAPLKGEHDN